MEKSFFSAPSREAVADNHIFSISSLTSRQEEKRTHVTLTQAKDNKGNNIFQAALYKDGIEISAVEAFQYPEKGIHGLIQARDSLSPVKIIQNRADRDAFKDIANEIMANFQKGTPIK